CGVDVWLMLVFESLSDCDMTESKESVFLSNDLRQFFGILPKVSITEGMRFESFVAQAGPKKLPRGSVRYDLEDYCLEIKCRLYLRGCFASPSQRLPHVIGAEQRESSQFCVGLGRRSLVKCEETTTEGDLSRRQCEGFFSGERV